MTYAPFDEATSTACSRSDLQPPVVAGLANVDVTAIDHLVGVFPATGKHHHHVRMLRVDEALPQSRPLLGAGVDALHARLAGYFTPW